MPGLTAAGGPLLWVVALHTAAGVGECHDRSIVNALTARLQALLRYVLAAMRVGHLWLAPECIL